ncbi:hypothetical protein GCM10017554_18460 [Acinetobacter modestus]|nr:hypothetical protein GCM10017554_18460 [Acinetobacter modestus]
MAYFYANSEELAELAQMFDHFRWRKTATNFGLCTRTAIASLKNKVKDLNLSRSFGLLYIFR